MAQVLDLSPNELVDALVEEEDRPRSSDFARESWATCLPGPPRPILLSPPRGRSPPGPSCCQSTTSTTVKQMAALHASQVEAGFRRARVVLVVRKPRWGGGRRMEGHIAHALATPVGSGGDRRDLHRRGRDAPAGRFPDGVREIDFASHAPAWTPSGRSTRLVMLLRSFQADSIVNVNSGCSTARCAHTARALAATERLFPIFFCNEQSEIGNWYGWPSVQFYRLFDQVTNIITDSDYLAEWFDDIYQLDASSREKLRVFRAPVDPDPARGLPGRSSPPGTIGRRSSGPGAGTGRRRSTSFFEVARHMPDVEFRMWGEPVFSGGSSRSFPTT